MSNVPAHVVFVAEVWEGFRRGVSEELTVASLDQYNQTTRELSLVDGFLLVPVINFNYN